MEAQKVTAETHSQMGDVLIQRKIITESQLLEALSILYSIPFRPNLPIDNFSADFTGRFPIQFLKKYLMVPLISETPSPGSNKGRELQDRQNMSETVENSSTLIAVNNPVHIQPLD